MTREMTTHQHIHALNTETHTHMDTRDTNGEVAEPRGRSIESLPIRPAAGSLLTPFAVRHANRIEASTKMMNMTRNFVSR